MYIEGYLISLWLDVGHYCLTGSPSPTQCPPGTNSSSYGLAAVTSCPPCTAGYYCPMNGTVYATLLCSAGYYCPSGTSLPSLQCPRGSFCVSGSANPAPCEAGTYQDQLGNDTCKGCPAGSYCGLNTSFPVTCPMGFFCPSQTQYGNQYPCSNGTFSNSTGLSTVDQCLPCSPGQYCGSTGLTQPTGNCSMGYFCGGGSSVATPQELARFNLSSYAGYSCVVAANNTRNDVCPPGEMDLTVIIHGCL